MPKKIDDTIDTEIEEDDLDLLSDDAVTAKAIDVLSDQMMFYHSKAEILISKIMLKLKEEKCRGELLVSMYKEYEKCSERARDCAAKLAPYQSSRLESLEVKQEINHSFVVRAPAKIIDTNSWLAMASIEQKELEEIENQKLITGTANNVD